MAASSPSFHGIDGCRVSTSAVTTAVPSDSEYFGSLSSKSAVSFNEPRIRWRSGLVKIVMYLSRMCVVAVNVATIGLPGYADGIKRLVYLR